MPQVSENDFKNWWADPVGQEVRDMLRERIVRISVQALAEPIIRDGIQAAQLLGRKLEIEDLLAMDYKELMGEEGR